MGDSVHAGRVRIDALDEQIIELIARRVQVARSIQQARLDGGGTRLDLAREQQVIHRYTAGLGRQQGAAVAMVLLELSRGPIAGGTSAAAR